MWALYLDRRSGEGYVTLKTFTLNDERTAEQVGQVSRGWNAKLRNTVSASRCDNAVTGEERGCNL